MARRKKRRNKRRAGGSSGEKPIGEKVTKSEVPRSKSSEQDDIPEPEPIPNGPEAVAASRGEEIHVEYFESYEGPIPHPHILKAYEEVVPGSAKQMVEEAWKQGEHRRKQEDRLVRNHTLSHTLGVTMAGLTSLGVLAGGVFLIATGRVGGGAFVVIAGLLPVIVRAFRAPTTQDGEERHADADTEKG